MGHRDTQWTNAVGKMMLIDLLNIQYSVTIKLQFVKKKKRRKRTENLNTGIAQRYWRFSSRHCNKANHYTQICFPVHIPDLKRKNFQLFISMMLAVGLSFIYYVESHSSYTSYIGSFSFIMNEWWILSNAEMLFLHLERSYLCFLSFILLTG